MDKYLKNIGAIGLMAVAAFVAIYLVAGSPKIKSEETNPSPSDTLNQENKSDNLKSTENNMKKEIAVLNTTAGEIQIELSTATPVTSSNFATLAKKGFYDNTIFHRVIKGFMIQGGDPNTTKPESNTNIYGTGGPGYKFNDEKFSGEYTRGTVAMANSGPNTNGSQFFIMHQDYPLPKNYVIFGHVIKGIEVVDKIASAEVTSNLMGEKSKPISPVSIESITITEE